MCNLTDRLTGGGGGGGEGILNRVLVAKNYTRLFFNFSYRLFRQTNKGSYFHLL